jgi:hypothetical protein
MNMPTLPPEFDELRVGIERLRALLENLIVRGLRACGSDELLQLKSLTDYLEQADAGHVAATLVKLHDEIEQDQRTSARTLLEAQTSVRVLERLLTLRIVRSQFAAAVQLLEQSAEQ